MVSGLVAAGVTPAEIQAAVPTHGDRLFRAADGELEGDAFAAAASADGRSFDPRRYFCDDDELIHHGGRTYAFTNQWGTGTEEAMRALLASFPDREIGYRSSNESAQ